ncbi:hypothetical protein GCM10027589_34970 [Actinocorallia lasiicapitis]
MDDHSWAFHAFIVVTPVLLVVMIVARYRGWLPFRRHPDTTRSRRIRLWADLLLAAAVIAKNLIQVYDSPDQYNLVDDVNMAAMTLCVLVVIPLWWYLDRVVAARYDQRGTVEDPAHGSSAGD